MYLDQQSMTNRSTINDKQINNQCDSDIIEL
jgi:hypothetical protein